MKLSIDVSSFEVIAIGLAVGTILARLDGWSILEDKKDKAYVDAERKKTPTTTTEVVQTYHKETAPILDFALPSRKDAEDVLENMRTVINQFKFVSVADLKNLVGLEGNYKDNDWGWTNLYDEIDIREVKRGYEIDLPQPEPRSRGI